MVVEVPILHPAPVPYVGRQLCCCAGTGKTTFLRALASHTKRSIINVPLSRIRTNQQLMSLMMDQQSG
jgi:hypothetical protein